MSIRLDTGFSPAYKRYALVVMTLVYLLSVVDRGLVMLLLQPIKESLSLSDTQLGFLTGFVFAAFYVTGGILMGRWADWGNRVTITALAIGLWGLAVMSSVFATAFTPLLFARMAAAIGEAGGKPPTYSLVGHYFPEPAERTHAMSIYMTGGAFSVLVSFILGGWLNELMGWRLTFLVLGIPGLVLAAIVKLTIIEPRQQINKASASAHSSVSIGSALATLWHRRTLRHLSLALIMLYIVSSGLGPWYAAFMIRSHGMSTAELGVWLGIIFSCAGVGGVLLGGYVARRWLPNNERAQMLWSAASVAFLVPCHVAFLILPQKYVALSAMIPVWMGLYAYQGPTYALIQRLVPEELWGTMMALVMSVVNLIGMGLGPQVVGIASDALAPLVGTDSLRYAMLIVSLGALLSAYHFWQAGRSVTEDLAISYVYAS